MNLSLFLLNKLFLSKCFEFILNSFWELTKFCRFERFSKVHEDNLRRIEELRAVMAVKREVECPKCSHKNEAVKGHRNRTRCSKCKTPFCYLCGLKHETVIDCEAYKKKRAYLMGIHVCASICKIRFFQSYIETFTYVIIIGQINTWINSKTWILKMWMVSFDGRKDLWL